MKTSMDLLTFIKTHEPAQPFTASVVVDVENQRISIYTEDVPCYHEWIAGEDSDITISRAFDDHRVVGAFLPLRKWTGELPVTVL
jgi:hypothetical protein